MNDSVDSGPKEDQAVQTVPESPDPGLPPKAIAGRVGNRNLWIGTNGAFKLFV